MSEANACNLCYLTSSNIYDVTCLALWHNYHELRQIHWKSAVSKTFVFRWHKKFQDGFTSHKDDSRPGQPKTVVTNANIAAVAGLIKRDTRLTVKNITHMVGISSGSAYKILTQQLKLRTECAPCAPIAWPTNKKATCMKMPIFFFIKNAKIVTNLKNQNYLQLWWKLDILIWAKETRQ